MPGIPQMGGAGVTDHFGHSPVFFGAKRVPELTRSLGKSMREFRRGPRRRIPTRPSCASGRRTRGYRPERTPVLRNPKKLVARKEEDSRAKPSLRDLTARRLRVATLSSVPSAHRSRVGAGRS